MKITAESHLDHGLTPSHVEWLLNRFKGRDAFFIETVTIPDTLAPVQCGLYGPIMGDEPVSEDAGITYAIRGNRKCASRMIARPQRETRSLTVIAGPDEKGNPCVLYTSYGGPQAPREPGDTTIALWDDVKASRRFWEQHALSNA